MLRSFGIALGLFMSFGAQAKAPRAVSVEDLDASVLPQDLAWDVRGDRLVVDGRPVKGSRVAQLAWLGQVLADEEGEAPASLRLEERTQSLRRRRTGLTTVLASSGAVVVLAAPVAALVVPVVAAAATTEVVAGTGALKADRRFDSEDLAREVGLQHSLLRDLQVASGR